MREVFTLINTALVLREKLALPHWEALCWWACGQVRKHHPRERHASPNPKGRRIWGHLLPPCQGLLPLMSWAFTVPRLPQKPQL